MKEDIQLLLAWKKETDEKVQAQFMKVSVLDQEIKNLRSFLVEKLVIYDRAGALGLHDFIERASALELKTAEKVREIEKDLSLPIQDISDRITALEAKIKLIISILTFSVPAAGIIRALIWFFWKI